MPGCLRRACTAGRSADLQAQDRRQQDKGRDEVAPTQLRPASIAFSFVGAQSLGERSDLAWSNNLLGLTKAHLGQYEDARAQAQVALALYRESDERAGVGHALLVLGHVALAIEAYAEAQQWLQESVVVYREIKQRDELGWALADLAVAARGLGDLCRARRHLSEALRMSTETPSFFCALGCAIRDSPAAVRRG